MNRERRERGREGGRERGREGGRWEGKREWVLVCRFHALLGSGRGLRRVGSGGSGGGRGGGGGGGGRGHLGWGGSHVVPSGERQGGGQFFSQKLPNTQEP